MDFGVQQLSELAGLFFVLMLVSFGFGLAGLLQALFMRQDRLERPGVGDYSFIPSFRERLYRVLGLLCCVAGLLFFILLLSQW